MFLQGEKSAKLTGFYTSEAERPVSFLKRKKYITVPKICNQNCFEGLTGICFLFASS